MLVLPLRKGIFRLQNYRFYISDQSISKNYGKFLFEYYHLNL